MVAGYCWDWVSQADPNRMDIILQEESFSAKWNLKSDGNLWIVSKDAVNEVGCIHTCQGLELDYVGVIFGPDLVVRNSKVIIQPGKRAKTDKSLNGYQKLLKSSPQAAREKAEAIVKNTYRTLMTRAQKGCFVYSVDPETNEYLRRMTGRPTSSPSSYGREQLLEESSRVRETPPEPNNPESKGTE